MIGLTTSDIFVDVGAYDQPIEQLIDAFHFEVPWMLDRVTKIKFL
jgi:hypothetical protein